MDDDGVGLTAPLHAGDRLTDISASVRVSSADDGSGSTAAGAGLTVDGAGDPNPYTVVGYGGCDRIFGGSFE